MLGAKRKFSPDVYFEIFLIAVYFRSGTFSFGFISIAMILGIFSAIQRSTNGWFGSWVTHPKMTGAGIAWLIWALALIAAWAPRFRGRRTAALSISGFILSLIVVAISYLVVE